MTAETAPSRRGSIAFEPELDGLGRLPARMALATLSPGRRSWLLLYVVVPVALLVGSLAVSPRVANGIVGLCGFLALALWATSHYQYDGVRIRIDGPARALTVTSGPPSGWVERTVDLERVDSVSVQVLGGTALVRVDAHAFDPIERFVLPEPIPVPADRLPAALEALAAAGVAVPDSASEFSGPERRSLEAVVRLLATPLALAGVPAYAALAFGPSILYTDGAVIVAILGAVAIARELSRGVRFRRGA